MNLGIYISTLTDTNQLSAINSLIDNIINEKSVHDISIFYDDVAFNPNNIKCGMFNSTDLWSFNGNLIVTSLDGLQTALKVINNINIFYYHGWEQNKNVLSLVMLTRKKVNIICKSEEDSKEIYRLTGIKSLGTTDRFNNILELLLGHKDEYKSNNNSVYQTA